ncbi:CRISPR-associated helicase/endonuclease Cas3 [Porphyromonas sp. HMSC065F10]|uniref:CRISPR-associated helicase/endonuclease Cas3 n=1 Tax=Porphyromonas sp. HMSC065F10 TaxID=1739394 RepID=UPI0008A196E7|nr:CRISPR-associated helicase/endonuclease Cas3 [Porphyromonas sp. HMSC065F10]
MEPHIAHIREEEKGCFAEQSIEEHCLNVARLARELTYEDEDSCGLKDLAYNAGLLHDFGKYRPDFQRYILAASGANQSGKVPPKAPHAIVGAIEARRLFDDPMIAETLAYCISGHHRGLYDHNEMERRLRHGEHKRWCDACEKLTSAENLETADCDDVDEPDDLQMAIRMLFSALVDADRLDTERFMTPDLSAERLRIKDNYASLSTLRERLRAKTESFSSAPDTPVNRARAYFLESCRTHGAESDPGIYTLSLPTGAGKTISSMAWALEMAIRNHHDRIIYVIPYTSIITQTAMVFREIFGEENILEHHSEVVVEQQGEDDKSDEQMSRLKFLTENWDAPIILTTNVQFFESLFASKPAKCRKVHSIANSVIVMDEVQALPESFLSPILSAISTLSGAFHCSILCCSATQPVYDEDLNSPNTKGEKYPPLVIKGDLVPREARYFAPFDRVDYHLEPQMVTSQELAERLAAEHSVLCVVNSRKDAGQVYRALRDLPKVNVGEMIHLSRSMCSAHLRKAIETIKERMREGEPTKVISTQLIEAGVDLDFPCVWRAHSGLGSIIQAGGRCNRDGKMEQRGQVFVFSLTDGSRPFGNIARGCNATKMLLHNLSNKITDPTDPEVIAKYYRLYFEDIPDFDTEGIGKDLTDDPEDINFESAAERFKLIDDEGTFPVIVPYMEEGKELVRKIRSHETLSREDYHRMQEYSVSLRQGDYTTLLGHGNIEQIPWGEDFISVLVDDDCYDSVAGVVISNHWVEETQTA